MPHVILSSWPSLNQTLSKLVGIRRSSNNFAHGAKIQDRAEGACHLAITKENNNHLTALV